MSAKGNPADIRPNVVADYKRGREHHPYHALEYVCLKKGALPDDNKDSHVAVGKLGELISVILALSQRDDKSHEACHVQRKGDRNVVLQKPVHDRRSYEALVCLHAHTKTPKYSRVSTHLIGRSTFTSIRAPLWRPTSKCGISVRQ